MSIKRLALFGGSPILQQRQQFPFAQTTPEDQVAVLKCFENNSFSAFRAGDYEGGEYVKKFEQSIRATFQSDYAVSFDTWSNGIIASLMSLGIGPGDEVLIAPYTMTSCSTSIMACGAIPVFCDVDINTGCISQESIIKNITPKTKAIFVVHLFGLPADMHSIMEIAEAHNLYVFEDCAQAPLASVNDSLCGTIGDIGGFSFTESKFVMGGEGGISITNDKKINNGLRVIRNHGEVCSTAKDNQHLRRVVDGEDSKEQNYNYAHDVLPDYGLLGFNFRMTELSASLIHSQWKRLEANIQYRRKHVCRILEGIKDIQFISPMIPKYASNPSWYVFPLRFIESQAGVSREKFVEALNAEGFNFTCGYCPPLYRQNLYHTNKHWSIKDVSYKNVDCPNIDTLFDKELFMTMDVREPYSQTYFDKMIQALLKVSSNLDKLK